MKQHTIKQYVLGIILGLGLVLGVSSLQAAWTVPDVAPPSGNVDAPINTGANGQQKLGSLIVNTNSTVTGPGPYAIGFETFGKSIFNGAVQINDGTAAAGKVLTATDSSGNMSWTTINVTAASSSSTGTVLWDEDFKATDSTAQIYCISTTGNGTCTGANPITMGCSDGNILQNFIISSTINGSWTDIHHKGYCVQGITGGSGGVAGVSSITAGTGVTISPNTGIGNVTVSATGATSLAKSGTVAWTQTISTAGQGSTIYTCGTTTGAGTCSNTSGFNVGCNNGNVLVESLVSASSATVSNYMGYCVAIQ